MSKRRNEVINIYSKIKFAGIDSDGGTPDPIPNSVVKSISGDGIAGVTLWESSTMPALFF